MPSFSYNIKVQSNKQQSPLAYIMMIDTILMCGNTAFKPPFDIIGPTMSDTDPGQLGAQYFRDFEARLQQIAATSVPYIIVVGHFPVWSIADHGPNSCLVQKLRPLLHKYKVSAYICGHDHNLQMIQDTYMGQMVSYVVTGAAGFADKSTKHAGDIPAGSLKFKWADTTLFGEMNGFTEGGFVVIQVDSKQMKVIFANTDDEGKELAQFVILPRK
jgi:tartrate-resistant acid phosphatase type 5